MLTSELIAELQKILGAEGDLDVRIITRKGRGKEAGSASKVYYCPEGSLGVRYPVVLIQPGKKIYTPVEEK